MNKILKFIKNTSFSERLLWLYIILIPFTKVPYFPLVGQKIQYSDLVFIPLFIIGIFSFWRGKKKILLIDKAMFVMLCIFLISFLFTNFGIRGFIEFIGMAYLLSMYFLLSRLIDDKEKWNRIIKLWAIVAIILSIVGILGYILTFLKKTPNFLIEFFIDKEHIRLMDYRIKSTFVTSNMFCAYIHASLFTIMFWIEKKREKGKQCFLSYCGLAICIIAAMLTYSRLNVGLLLTLFCILLITKGGRILQLFRYIFFLLVVTYLILASILTIWWIAPIKIEYSKEANSIGLYINKSKTVYYYLNIAALKMMRDNPFFGVGMGNFNKKSIDYIDENARSVCKSFSSPTFYESYKKGTFDPHSTFFGWGAETGIIGLISIVIFLSTLLRKFWFDFRYSVNSLWKYASGVLFFTIIGFIINGFYVDILTMRHLWFIIAVGVSGIMIYQ